MADLFSQVESYQPLAARMRPTSLSEYAGQTHLLAEGKPLRKALQQDLIHSMILWGPPGVGKTSLAQVIAQETQAQFISVSAILSGVKDIRQAIDQATQFKTTGQRTLLFVDEVHRFNKAQQDAFLPYIEDGTVIFVGATTENPSFELNNALLSRCRVYKLKPLQTDELALLIDAALTDDKRGLGELKLQLEPDARELLLQSSNGDSRQLLNYLEIIADTVDAQEEGARITADHVKEVIGDRVRHFDKGGDLFYEQISALHKSLRGSNPDAALYWCCRMLDAGCDPLYVARRLVRMASEDIGNADPRALQIALNAWDVQHRLGSPEGELAIAQAVLYLASAPKSNAAYMAYKKMRQVVAEDPGHDVPVHLRNAPTKLMKEIGYGEAYRYSHDEPDAYSAGQTYFPPEVGELEVYQPVERGLEIQIGKKLAHLRELNHGN
ncbi:replication-associated recombination protein A [Pleionea sp. CnH1-48]|uniref:replication-associated recombination protein A n=1 Tax=Pleionea sp. CnH1-48 TaxID=2954494 RepID=UPI00209863EE|nr:replication-associated recombination protein A [Pleionea sp. CnH1-48]MCO7222755.1 replication-associated recombination protein A [Pleionea sp. CnH1-48]